MYPMNCACVLSHFSHVWLFMTLWIVACQAPLSKVFSRQEDQSGLPCLSFSRGPFPNQGSNLRLLRFLHWRWQKFRNWKQRWETWLSGAWTPGCSWETEALWACLITFLRARKRSLPKRPAPGESYRHQVASMQLSCGARAGLKPWGDRVSG